MRAQTTPVRHHPPHPDRHHRCPVPPRQPGRDQDSSRGGLRRSGLNSSTEAQAAFEVAALEYEDAVIEVDRVERKQESVAGSVSSHTEQDQIQAGIEEQAVELCEAGWPAGIIFSASSVDEFMTTSEFSLSPPPGDRSHWTSWSPPVVSSIDSRRSSTTPVSSWRQSRPRSWTPGPIRESAMEAEQEAYAQLSGRCKEPPPSTTGNRQARGPGRQRASGSVQVGSFICPFTPGRTSFIDSWGAPRSGGRAHKGTDLFAAWNEPMYAVAPGRVALGSSGLGGNTIWLLADNGIAYYYAHLSGFNVSSGSSVGQGQTIGFNGDSGNARGGSPSPLQTIPVGGGRRRSIPIQRWRGHAGSLPPVSEHRRTIDIVLEPGYLADISEADLDDLRQRREAAGTSKVRFPITGASFTVGSICSISSCVAAAGRRRSLIEALPEILASGMTLGNEPNLRHLDTMPPLPASTGRRLIDKIMDDGILTGSRLTDSGDHEAIDRASGGGRLGTAAPAACRHRRPAGRDHRPLSQPAGRGTASRLKVARSQNTVRPGRDDARWGGGCRHA